MTAAPFLFVCFCSWPAICIHGDKAQQEREWVLEGNRRVSDIYGIVKYKVVYSLQNSELVNLLFS